MADDADRRAADLTSGLCGLLLIPTGCAVLAPQVSVGEDAVRVLRDGIAAAIREAVAAENARLKSLLNDTVKATAGRLTSDAIREAYAAGLAAGASAERERCARAADLVACNYRESAALHGADEPLACYRSRASAADAVARRIREGAA